MLMTESPILPPSFRNMKGVLIGDVVGPFTRSHIHIDGNHLAPKNKLGKVQDMPNVIGFEQESSSSEDLLF